MKEIKELEGTDIQIGDQIITGFIRDELCDKCSSQLIYHDIFDSDLCPTCNEWKESSCPDPTCDICIGKPKKPLSYMAMQPNTHITYENITDIIDQVFPEYTKWDSYDVENKELPYIHLATFAMEILDNLDNPAYKDIAIRLMQFTNFIINNYGDDLHNLFGIEVFENLAGSRKGAHLAKEYLTDKALESFHETTKFYHTHEFLEEYFKVFGMHPIYANEPQSLWKVMSEINNPAMNPPKDDELLWDIRTNLEVDEGLIAGTLSYLIQQQMPSEEQIKNLRTTHRQNFSEYKDRLKNHQIAPENKEYAAEILSFIDDLGRIAANIDIWYYNTFHK